MQYLSGEPGVHKHQIKSVGSRSRPEAGGVGARGALQLWMTFVTMSNILCPGFPLGLSPEESFRQSLMRYFPGIISFWLRTVSLIGGSRLTGGDVTGTRRYVAEKCISVGDEQHLWKLILIQVILIKHSILCLAPPTVFLIIITEAERRSCRSFNFTASGLFLFSRSVWFVSSWFSRWESTQNVMNHDISDIWYITQQHFVFKLNHLHYEGPQSSAMSQTQAASTSHSVFPFLLVASAVETSDIITKIDVTPILECLDLYLCEETKPGERDPMLKLMRWFRPEQTN